MSKEKTVDEVRSDLMHHIRNLVEYWANLPGDQSVLDRCDGVAFSIMAALDGVAAVPAFDLAVQPHPDDKAYHQANGEDWYPEGLVINEDVHLHDLYAQISSARGKEGV